MGGQQDAGRKDLKIKIVNTFLGEVRRSRHVASLADIEDASRELALGEGWGQTVEGTAAELAASGGYEVAPGAWVMPLQSAYLVAEVSS